MKKKLVLLAGVVAAAWGVKKLIASREETEWRDDERERGEDRIAA